MRKTICVITSAGGHLTEAMKATAELKYYPTFYVTFKLPHIHDSLRRGECYFIEDPHTNCFKYLKNSFQCLIVYLKKRPKVIITTGAGIAIPMCIIGKLFGSQIIFIEISARIRQPSRTAKILYPIADLFIVQWKPLLKYFPKAIYGGCFL